jgi:cellulose synthase/poly-beta-1,6-N-acetylglucosamine synthase-like glycosyltransferase
MDGPLAEEPAPRTAAVAGLDQVGVVAIGRNEGERLQRCLDAIPAGVGAVVYVDSASTDDSVAQARRRGVEVVALDMSVPFTAARARNAGLARLRQRWPDLCFVQFVDGDCALDPGWLGKALDALCAAPHVAVVCGRRREIDPAASVFNRLADMEWDTPVGDAEASGGDALIRSSALQEVGGYDGGLIAGEEPEMCARLRARGWVIRRIDAEMTRHDLAMTRLGQWWRRAVRGGHAYAEVSALHPPLWSRQRRSIVAWGMAVPLSALAAAPFTHGLSLLLLLGYPVLGARILVRRLARGDALRDAGPYALFCVVGKFPEALGVARFGWNRLRGRRGGIIEYK